MNHAYVCDKQITNKASSILDSPHHPKQLMATADSGASGIYIAKQDMAVVSNPILDTPSTMTHVQAAEGSVMSSHATGDMTFKGMPDIPFKAQVFNDLQSTLLGVGAIVDKANVKAVLSTDGIQFINKDGDVVLSGPRCANTGLWSIDLQAHVHRPTDHHALSVRPLPMDSVGDLVAWWHASFGYPVVSTFLRALATWLKDKIPGVTLERAQKYKKQIKCITSAKGHLNQTRKNARSTQTKTDSYSRTRTQKHNIIVHLITDQERNDMDIAHLLHDKYLMVFYSHGGNYIHIELLDATTEFHVLRAYKQGVKFFESKGLKPNVQRMDNYSAFLAPAFTEFQANNDITVDRVPPGQHRRNKAERCIETAKHHIIASLAGTDPDFPMKGIKHLMPQMELTLNLLRQARKNTKMSAWEQLHGEYDFNAHPLGPMGCRILSHDKPENRESWGLHGTEGFYIGPSLDHYRCYEVLIQSTNRTRTTDTLSWHPDMLSTKSSCSLARLRGAIQVVTRAITSVGPGDITHQSRQEFSSLANSLSTLTEALRTKVAAAVAQQRVSPMTGPAADTRHCNTPVSEPRQLPPIIANEVVPLYVFFPSCIIYL